MRKNLLIPIATIVVAASPMLTTTAHAATAKANGSCVNHFASTTIAGQKYICSPASVGSKKYIWTLNKMAGKSAGSTTGVKPTIAGQGGYGGSGDHHFGGGFNPNNPAFAAFKQCLSQAGITMPQPPANGAPATPGTRPQLTAAQHAAMVKCRALMPHRNNGGANGQNGNNAGANQ